MRFLLRISDNRRPVSILPAEGPFDGVSGVIRPNVEVPRSTLSRLCWITVADVLLDIGSESRTTNSPAVLPGIESGIKVEIPVRDVQLQCADRTPEERESSREQLHVAAVHRCRTDRSDDIAGGIDDGDDLAAFLVLMPRIADLLAPFLATVFVPSP